MSAPDPGLRTNERFPLQDSPSPTKESFVRSETEAGADTVRVRVRVRVVRVRVRVGLGLGLGLLEG